jgi:hypothetical protein
MNSPLLVQAAKNLLAREQVAGETSDAGKISRLYQLAFGREPAAEEIAWAQQFLSQATSPAAGWDQLAQGLLLANEFVFVD